MGRLLIVRHAQASFLADNYDQLSELGYVQSSLLGKFLADSSIAFDRVIIGSLLRHRQTAEAAGKEYKKKGHKWIMDTFREFDEHQGPEVVQQVLANKGFFQQEDYGNATHSPTHLIKKQYFSAFQEITQKWIQEDASIGHEQFESWKAFRLRVKKGLNRLIEESNRGDTILLFTSGGPVAAVLGEALELSEGKTLEMSWIVNNTSVSEFLFSKQRFSLKSFNLVSHLSPEHITLV